MGQELRATGLRLDAVEIREAPAEVAQVPIGRLSSGYAGGAGERTDDHSAGIGRQGERYVDRSYGPSGGADSRLVLGTN